MRKCRIHPKLGTAVLTRKVADDLDLRGDLLASQVTGIGLSGKAVPVGVQQAPVIRLVWLSRHLTSNSQKDSGRSARQVPKNQMGTIVPILHYRFPRS